MGNFQGFEIKVKYFVYTFLSYLYDINTGHACAVLRMFGVTFMLKSALFGHLSATVPLRLKHRRYPGAAVGFVPSGS